MKEVCQRGRDGCMMRYKFHVVGCQPKERAQFLDIRMLWPVQDGLDFVRIHADPLGTRSVAEEVNCWLEEGALGQLGIEFMLPQPLKHLLLMLLLILAENENVVKVHNDALIQQWPEDVVHEAHEGGWSIREAERHHCELIVAVACPKGCFWNILLGNADLMVPAAQVNIGEDCGALRPLQKLINSWKRVSVFDSHLVEGSVVHAHAHAAVLFLDKQYRSAIWGLVC